MATTMPIGNLIANSPPAATPFGGADEMLIIQGGVEKSTTPSQLFVSTAGHLPGTTTGDNAAPGQVGEVISSVVPLTTVALPTAAAVTVTSISLTPGDWDVYGEGWVIGGAMSSLNVALNTVAATLPSAPTMTASVTGLTGSFSNAVLSPAPIRLSLAVTTLVYLIAEQTSAAGVTGGGKIYGRRAR